jgi:LIM-domain binding protein
LGPQTNDFLRQQQLMQQMAMQAHHANAQAQAGGNTPGQQGQMGPQQMQNLQQQAQIAAAQHQAQAAQAAAAQQNQQQSQPQNQQSQPNSHGQNQQAQPQAQPQPSAMQQQAAATAMLQNQQRAAERFKGQCLMKLMLFGDHLSNFSQISKPLEMYRANGAQRLAAQSTKQRDDLNYWLQFVDRFFSPKGVLRHSIWFATENTGKQYEITFPALARYFHTHFESGITSMQMIMEKGVEKELPNNGHYVESQKSSFVYWFDTGSQVCFSHTIIPLLNK